MEFKNIEQLYSSEHSHIFLVEGSDGRLYTKKDRGISPEVADKLRDVKSPYVAELADYGDDFTILEYAQGTPLSDLKPDSRRACEIFGELCDGISALHRAGILHRDIKPSNVIVCDDGHIKIIDFDAARIKKPAADKDTVFMGTDGFAPPEQFGFTQTDERSDIYALGVTFKVILGENYQRSRYRRLIEKCTRFNPEQRYKSIGAVKRALALRKHMRVLCAAAVLLLAVCAAVIGADSKRIGIWGEDINSLSTSETVFTNEETQDSAPELPADEETRNSTAESPSKENTPAQPETSIIESTAGSFESAEIKNAASGEAEPVPEYPVPQPPASSSTTSSTSASTPTPAPTVTTSAAKTTPSSSAAPAVSPTEEPAAIIPDAFEVPEGSQRTIPWELLWLPEGFPKLADGVTKYSTQGGSIFLEWDIMSLEETQYMSALLQQWIGIEKSFWSNDDKMYSDCYFADEYEVLINRYTDRAVNGRNQTSVSVIAEFPDLSLTYDPSGINNVITKGSGNILWENMDFLSDERLAGIPTLTDYVTETSRDSYSQNIYWDKMSVLEAAAIVYRVSEWLGTYPRIQTSDSVIEWTFDNFYIKWRDTEVYGGYQTHIIIHDDFNGTD